MCVAVNDKSENPDWVERRPRNMEKMKVDDGSITIQVKPQMLENMKEQAARVLNIRNVRGLGLFFGFGS